MNSENGLLALPLCTICLVLAFLFPPLAQAQAVKVGDIEIDPRDFSADRDPQTRLAPCLACHGAQAGGDIDFGPDVRFGTPALRGLEADYLEESLIAYKTGSRQHEEMRVIAAMLDEATIGFMARSLAAFPAAPLKSADDLAVLAAQDSLFRQGQAIAREGLPEKEVPACMDCHGAMGEGDADLGPRLAGQNGLYIRQQFAAYADGTRQTEQAVVMQPVAAGLSGDDVEAVAHYYEQLIRVDGP